MTHLLVLRHHQLRSNARDKVDLPIFSTRTRLVIVCDRTDGHAQIENIFNISIYIRHLAISMSHGQNGLDHVI